MEIDDFIEDGGGVILLIVLAAIFLPKLIQRFRTGGFTPLIKVLDYKIGDQDSKPGTLLEIEGNRAGFGAWLLDLLGLKSRHIKVLFHKNYKIKLFFSNPNHIVCQNLILFENKIFCT